MSIADWPSRVALVELTSPGIPPAGVGDAPRYSRGEARHGFSRVSQRGGRFFNHRQDQAEYDEAEYDGHDPHKYPRRPLNGRYLCCELAALFTEVKTGSRAAQTNRSRSHAAQERNSVLVDSRKIA